MNCGVLCLGLCSNRMLKKLSKAEACSLNLFGRVASWAQSLAVCMQSSCLHHRLLQAVNMCVAGCSSELLFT